ncbi:MAG: P-loop NTPase [Thermofilaceae archaeon]
MRFPFFGKKKKKEEETEEVVEALPRKEVVGGDATVLGVLSGKGGCGKSMISTNIVVLLSALSDKNQGVMGVDLDITNATLTSMLLSLTPDVLREDDGVSSMDYMVEEPTDFKAYKLEFPPKRVLSVQVAKRKDLGVAVKNIYVLPAKKATISYEVKLSHLTRLTNEEVRNTLQMLYHNIMAFARRNNVRYVVFDFPPLRADTRNVYEGVFGILDMIPNFILVSSFDYSAVHGLISLISRKYNFVKPRTLGFIINMYKPGNEDMAERIRNYIENIYGEGKVFFIRDDPRWRVGILPPIVLGDPSEGAHYDLIKACVKLGIIDGEVVKKKLNVEVH